ncbi:MAG: rhodanese-like domain-containing protein [Acidobacteria bacterium]|nr:rhodanese-like domain-containing protein [Acidobacteriota bacterium]
MFAPLRNTLADTRQGRNIPLDTLAAKLDTLERNEPVYIICQTGSRSKKAAKILKSAGFNNVIES